MASRVRACRTPASVRGFGSAQYSRTGFQNVSTKPASYPLPFWVTMAEIASGSVRASRQPPGAPQLASQFRGQPGQRVEGVVVLGGRRGRRQPEAEIVRRDDVERAGQQR